MPPGAAPTKPGVKGKPLPKWVWLVAIAGGLAVGFLLLKKSPTQGEGEGGEGGAAQGGDGSGGGSDGGQVAAPPLYGDAVGEALGLRPPSDSGGFNVGYGDSGSDSGGALTKSEIIAEAMASGNLPQQVGKTSTSTDSRVGTSDPRAGVTKTTTSTPTRSGSNLFKAA